jgi:hypothetical protein
MRVNELLEKTGVKVTCGCTEDSCSHCAGKHTLEEVGNKCNCCGNEIREVSATNEGDNFGMSPQQRKLANLGRVLMDQATTTKNDELANVMAKVGNELTNFGANFGPKSLDDLVKKTDVPAPVIQKLLAYADKILTAQNDIKADHKDGGLNDSMYETTTAGAVASVAAPVGKVQRRIPANGLDSDNLMGGPKKKKKKS